MNCPDQTCLRTVASQYPAQVAWTVTFDGRRLGRIQGKTPKEFHYYSGIGLQEITTKEAVPTVGQRSLDFSGWIGSPVYRPLVTNSLPYFKDPEAWKPGAPSAQVIGLLRKGFRAKFPQLCRASKENESKLEPFPYRDDEVQLIKAYASKKGWTVAGLHLEGAIDCNDLEAGFDITDKWLVVTPQRQIRYLDGGMWLVDAGDYDNDGKSELIFSISDYNRGGYRLFYDDFKQQVGFEFGYH